MWSQFPQTGPHTFRISRQIEWPQRADFAVTDYPAFRFHPDERTIKDGHGLAARPVVGTLAEWQFHAVGKDAADFHFQ